MEGVSAGWSNAELLAVLKFREDVLQIISYQVSRIRQLNEKLQIAYNELDTFSSTISHDLKTPLSSVKNYTEILLRNYNNIPGNAIDILGRILSSANKMNCMINEVLEYSRIGRKEIEKETIDMYQLLKEIKAEVLMAYNADNIEFILGNTPPLQGDKLMLNQMFTNLLSNAVKYSRNTSKPKVSITGKVSGNETIYTISDNGVGIDISFGNQIFDMFKRMGNAAAFEGSGVGLSIVKRILERHRAKIWYESELNKGTTFYISFTNS